VTLASPPTPEPDLALMAAVAARDSAAQQHLVKRLAGRTSRLTRFLCASQADADDATQLALMEILKSADGFRTAMSLEHWADRITVRTALRMRRRERAHRSLLERWLVPGSLPWGSRGDFATSEGAGLEKMLARLSVERRQAFVLRHALEYSVEEIAELTSAPLGTVKDRLVLARRQLRDMLKREEKRAARGRQP
jgi:RNA polymerase sigma-70 factor, ECF subfamily